MKMNYNYHAGMRKALNIILIKEDTLMFPLKKMLILIMLIVSATSSQYVMAVTFMDGFETGDVSKSENCNFPNYGSTKGTNSANLTS